MRKRPIPVKKPEHHGLKGSAIYAVWNSMIERCHGKRIFPRYGGRGITVCERWRNSVVAFVEDMGPRPSSKHSIDRINNDGNYEPGNCRWATPKEQQRNTSANRFLTIDGKTQTIIDWAEEKGIEYETLRARLKRGVPQDHLFIERIVPLIEFRGEKLSIAGWAKRVGITKQAMCYRLDKGWPLEVALTTAKVS